MMKSQRKYNKFGKGEHANGAVDDEDGFVDLTLICISAIEGDEDSLCGFCSKNECDFDDEEFDELYGDIDLSEAFVTYEVDINNFDFSDKSLDTLVEWKDAVLREEKMHKDYNTFTDVDDDKSSEEWNDVDEDDNGISGPEYASFACSSCNSGGHDYDKCLALTQQEVT